MIARRHRLDDTGDARRVETSEEQCRFHLRRSDRAVGIRSGWRARGPASAAAGVRRGMAAKFAPNSDSGSITRRHRPARQRGVAGEHRRDLDGWRAAPSAAVSRCRNSPCRARLPGWSSAPTPGPLTSHTPFVAAIRSPRPTRASTAAVASTSSPSSSPGDATGARPRAIPASARDARSTCRRARRRGRGKRAGRGEAHRDRSYRWSWRSAAPGVGGGF